MTPRLAASLMLLAAATTAAQTPVRDQPRFISTGSASVTGTVMADDGTTPIRRASVSLERATGEDSRTVATDDSGQFVFDRLAAATYTLSATKGAYIAMSYGAPKPGMPGSSIVLADGQAFAARPMALMRGGVIAGRLTDQAGRPMSSVVVRADQFVTVNGNRRRRTTIGSGGSSSTNAHGDFRIYGLLPGEYVVYATPSTFPIQSEVTADELAWANQRTTATPAPAPLIALAPTMFPGTTDVVSGVVITLGRGEERAGVDFPVRFVPVSRVTGTVLALDGTPAVNALVLCSLKTPNALIPPNGQMMSPAGTDGAFTCSGLAPGTYVLAARIPPPSSDAAPRPGLAPGSGASPLRWGLADVTVTGRDIANVVIRELPGLSVSGQARFEPAGTTPSLDPTRVLLRAIPATPLPVAGASASVRADGTFLIAGMVAGSYRIVPTLPLGPDSVGWTMRSAMLGGKDVADVPFDLGQDTSGLVVTFSNVQTELTGTLTDAVGKPAPQLYVFVFPADKSLWGSARRVQSVRSREDGSYRITGLPSGAYNLCALTELETTLQTEPSYLEQFVSSSITITLGEGEKKTQSLRIGG